jgi:plastocyanin domain-containing protein
MKTTTAIGVGFVIIVSAWYLVTYGASGFLSNFSVNKQTSNEEENSSVKDGVQYVTIVARGGYTPKKSFAKAGLPTKLVVKTNGTYDCSASLVINSLNYRKMLPNTGETLIDVGTPKVGDILQGVCGMGMYSFTINFR